jgi:alpha-tubulin suppressor-like RCC1 family protein
MRFPLRVAAFTSVLAILACGGSETDPKTSILSIGRDSTLLVDEIEPLAAFTENGTSVPASSITWLSSAPNVASIDANGHVTALTIGQTTISATSRAASAHITIAVAAQFIQIATGEAHTCGITGRIEVYCWGSAFDGELGSVTTLSQCEQTALPCSTTPVLATHMQFSSIVAGAQSTCGLEASSSAYCWGANFYGQLGNGSTVANSSPQLVAGGLRFTQLVAGRFHTCGITTDQDAYCWGWDWTGQLGAGDVSAERCTYFSLDPCSTTPRLVTGAHKWVLLSADDRATCGVDTTGVTYCWGLDIGGNDGLYCQEADNLQGCAHAPIQVGSDHRFRDISIGDVHRCEQTADEKIECWGANYWGAFGDGTTEYSATPVTAAGGAAYPFFIATRTGVCGLEANGHAQCWGNDAYG